MRTKLAVFLAGVGLLAPVYGHHSFAAEFDQRKPITLAGCVTKVEWMNPHAHFYIDVKDATGKVTNWDLEMGSPNGLYKEGWNRNSLKTGDDVVIQGFRAKDGSNLANAVSVTFADGRKVSAASSADAAK
ncbi:MAG TPA: DUF6152 family protein [Bryobacteraceae bacterium]|jgi:hypothetical protein